MVAVAIHQIGTWLHKMDLSLHKDDAVLSWMPEEIPGLGRVSYLF